MSTDTSSTTPPVELASLSELTTVLTKVVVATQQGLVAQFSVIGTQTFREVNELVKRQEAVIDDCFHMYGTDRIGADIFLASINNPFAVLAGVRQFILTVADTLPRISLAGDLSSQGRWILEEAERELESMMGQTLGRLREVVRHEPHHLYWDEETGFHLHRLRIVGGDMWS